MDIIRLEKILHLADKHGSYGISSAELHNSESLMDLIYDMCHTKKYLKWKTNDGSSTTGFYDTHWYEITPRGRVRLAFLRLSYAYRKKKEDLSKRKLELVGALHDAKLTFDLMVPELTKNEINACKNCDNVLESTDKSTEPKLQDMFTLSKLLGNKQITGTRSDDYVYKKAGEELGELSVEIQVEQGVTYKTAGKDGIAGEAVDLAICAMDMFALQYPDLNAAEIEKEFLKYMKKKLEKWKSTL